MNILPKKRWHVRTKDNIARVRRDEAAAQEEERKKEERKELAETEARLGYLRQKAGVQSLENDKTKFEKTEARHPERFDLFADYKSFIKTTNADNEKEQKEEREKYEKQIGYLTYLGQDTNEALKSCSWYEVAPKHADITDSIVIEKDTKTKHNHDPLTLINALLPPEKKKVENTNKASTKHDVDPSIIKYNNLTLLKLQKGNVNYKKKQKKKELKKSKKNKKEKRHKSSKRRRHSSDDKDCEVEQKRKKELLERLRKERLSREASERERQEALLRPKTEEPTASMPRIVQKYNSQFNPELAKQNLM